MPRRAPSPPPAPKRNPIDLGAETPAKKAPNANPRRGKAAPACGCGAKPNPVRTDGHCCDACAAKVAERREITSGWTPPKAPPNPATAERRAKLERELQERQVENLEIWKQIGRAGRAGKFDHEAADRDVVNSNQIRRIQEELAQLDQQDRDPKKNPTTTEVHPAPAVLAQADHHRAEAEKHLAAIAEESGAYARSVRWNAEQVFVHAAQACEASGVPLPSRPSPSSGHAPTLVDLPSLPPLGPHPLWPEGSPTVHSLLGASEDDARVATDRALRESGQVRNGVNAHLVAVFERERAAGKPDDKAREAANRITAAVQEEAAHATMHAALAKQALGLRDFDTAMRQADKSIGFVQRLERFR